MAVNPKEPEPVSEFVRQLLEEWETSGKTFKALAKAAGLGTSMPSQIKGRTSDVTNYSGPKLAKVFGMTYPELVSRAYEWWAAKQRGEAPPTDVQHPDRSRAIEMAKTFGASDDAIRRVLQSHNGPEFEDLDGQAWMLMFLQEAQNEHRAASVKRAEKSEKRTNDRKRKAFHAEMSEQRTKLAEEREKAKAREDGKRSA